MTMKKATQKPKNSLNYSFRPPLKRNVSGNIIDASHDLPKSLRPPYDIVKVGPYDYIIKYINIVMVDAAEMAGSQNEEYRVIHLATFLDRYSLIQTMKHEINHAIMDVFGLKRKRSEDDFCELFANAWVMVYRDNPWFLDWMNKLLFAEDL